MGDSTREASWRFKDLVPKRLAGFTVQVTILNEAMSKPPPIMSTVDSSERLACPRVRAVVWLLFSIATLAILLSVGTAQTRPPAVDASGADACDGANAESMRREAAEWLRRARNEALLTEDVSRRESLLRRVADGQADINDRDGLAGTVRELEALRAAQMGLPLEGHTYALARYWIRLGDLTNARALLDGLDPIAFEPLDERRARDEMLGELALAQARAGHHEGSKSTLLMMTDLDLRAFALIDIALFFRGVNAREEYEEDLRMAHVSASQGSEYFPFMDGHHMVANHLLEAGDIDGALRQMKEPSGWIFSLDVVDAMVKAGRYEQADKWVRKLKDPSDRHQAWYRLAGHEAERGNMNVARRQIEDLVEAARLAEDDKDARQRVEDEEDLNLTRRVFAVQLATLYAKIGDRQRSLDWLGMLKPSYESDSPASDVELVGGVAVVYRELGDGARSETIRREAETRAHQLEDPKERSRAFVGLCSVYSRNGHLDAAMLVFKRIERPSDRRLACSILGSYAAQQGRLAVIAEWLNALTSHDERFNVCIRICDELAGKAE